MIEFHAEATSEKMAFGHYVDGRVSLVVGTHTHVPTADHQILKGGTAYMSDAGMCGDYDSVIGMDKEEPLNRFTAQIAGGADAPSGRRCDGVRHSSRDRRRTPALPSGWRPSGSAAACRKRGSISGSRCANQRARATIVAEVNVAGVLWFRITSGQFDLK